MARSSQTVLVGKRTIELSNLEKVFYPDVPLVKAEIIEYYLRLAPILLAHLKNRPLSLVRFPDGLGGERFFQKNRPDWAPDWIAHVALSGSEKEEPVDYVLATEEASLVWLANLACIELHQMACRAPHFDHPDYFVFDLDPPAGYPFRDLVALALDLKEQLETLAYHPFVKTSGSKGLHVLVPVEPRWTFAEVFGAAKDAAGRFIAAHPGAATLTIGKEARRGKVLVDIYRNRNFQTIVSAYSLRGLPGAPVSMPLRWDELNAVESSAAFSLAAVPGLVARQGDAWEGLAAWASPLHTARSKRSARKGPPPPPAAETAAALAEYAAKRSFGKTPEPPPRPATGAGDAFVLHRHHATRLHYDLRLEQGPVLKSWAVPKGLPPRPGILRLAVATEDHPREYLDFEGSIPPGQYGAGRIWIYARGQYEVTREKKKGFYFRLQGGGLDAEYRMHSTGPKEWLLERLDPPPVDWLRDPIEPMLAQSAAETPGSDSYIYEVKWDGIRALIAVDEGEVRIRSRNHVDLTARFPELLDAEQAFRTQSALFDAEIVCLDDAGKPVFKDVIHRIQQKTPGAVERSRARHPALGYVFDCLYLDGRPLVNEPLYRRRIWLEDALKKNTSYRVSEAVAEGAELFRAAVQMGLEGVMAKEKNSTYRPGLRSAQWLKIKGRETLDCLIIGYTRGKGGREARFGALQLAVREDGALRYVGKVGTGFDERSMAETFALLQKLKETARPIAEKPPDDAQTVWVEPVLISEVQYASWTRDGLLREPVFLRLRLDRLEGPLDREGIR